MFKTLFIFLTALTALQLFSAGTGIASDASALHGIKGKAPEPREKVLALFIDALLEKNPGKQCLKLLDAAAGDINNAEIPLQAFRAAFQKLKNRKKVLEKFNALWAKYPDHLLVSLHGSSLSRACSIPAERRLEQLAPLLKRDPQTLIGDPLWKKAHIFTLLPNAAEIMLRLGKYKELLSLFDKWYKTSCSMEAGFVLADFCYTAAARSYASGNTALGKKLENCFHKAAAAVDKAAAKVTDRKTAGAILAFYSDFRRLMPGKAIGFARVYNRRIRSTESNLWLLSAAVEQGSLPDFNKAVALITEINPRFDSTELRFKTLLNAGMFAEAEKNIKKLPSKLHFDLMCQLYTRQKDWNALFRYLTAYLEAGAPPDLRTGYLLLTISEKTGDTAKFRMAEKIFKPHLKHPDLANAVGYISAVLDLELPRARKLLEYALKKDPRNAAYLDSMAWIAFKQKRYAEAEKWISKALAELKPREGVATIFEHAGDIAAARGKSPLHYYTLSLKYAPFELEFEKKAVVKKIGTFK